MKRTIRNSYYVYTLIDSITNQPFYVGKGYGTRMYSHKTEALKDPSEWSNTHKCRKIRKILQRGGTIIYDSQLCESEAEAIVAESQLIEKYGLAKFGGILTNISAAGQIANPVCHPIDCYTKDGKYVKTFSSANHATRELGLADPSLIYRCIRKYDTLQTIRGLVFVLKGEPFTYVDRKTKIVVATNKETGEVKEFVGTKAASQFLKRSLSCVRQSAKNGWTIDGYILKYKEVQE